MRIRIHSDPVCKPVSICIIWSVYELKAVFGSAFIRTIIWVSYLCCGSGSEANIIRVVHHTYVSRILTFYPYQITDQGSIRHRISDPDPEHIKIVYRAPCKLTMEDRNPEPWRKAVFRIRTRIYRIHMFSVLPDPIVRGMDPDQYPLSWSKKTKKT
jgi:hypothetical protein